MRYEPKEVAVGTGGEVDRGMRLHRLQGPVDNFRGHMNQVRRFSGVP